MPMNLSVGFIGLGNVGGKLAGSLIRNGVDLTVRDLDRSVAEPLLKLGAKWGENPKAMATTCDVVITCLPTPEASAAVLEAADGLLAGFAASQIAVNHQDSDHDESDHDGANQDGANQDGANQKPETHQRRKVWAEMSTTDEAEVLRLGELVLATGAAAVDCPVSGGCHRAATGNIAILAGCDRETFEQMLPLLTVMGRQVLHTGPLGSASVLKVITNYLASANLLSLTEALVTSKAAGMDLATTYEAIRISSGNSFVHETESQVILNGSRDISFTMDLVIKDLGLFQDVAERNNIALELAPVMRSIFDDAQDRYGPREWSPNVIRRLEDATGLDVLAPGFPAEMSDTEPEARGEEVTR